MDSVEQTLGDVRHPDRLAGEDHLPRLESGQVNRPQMQKWHEEHPEPEALKWKVDETGESYANPPGYSDTVDHQANFYNAVRTRKPVVENEVFGHNAAIGCHLANFSYFEKCVAVYDKSAKKIVKG